MENSSIDPSRQTLQVCRVQVRVQSSLFFRLCEHLFDAQDIIVPVNIVTKLHPGKDCRNFRCDHPA